MREHDHEPIPGLPERLPAGEVLLWQGAPDWRVLARRAFHARKVALYFLLLLAWQGIVVVNDGAPFSDFVAAALWLVPMGAIVCAILVLMAWGTARTTVYSITSKRVVMRFGIALPMSINLPFTVINDAQLKTYADGTGDIALALGGKDRVSYLHFWPHVRRWHITNPQPMLRAVRDVGDVGRILVAALRAKAEPIADVSSPSLDAVQQLAAAG